MEVRGNKKFDVSLQRRKERKESKGVSRSLCGLASFTGTTDMAAVGHVPNCNYCVRGSLFNSQGQMAAV